jgi:hypothetical protein
MSTQILTVQYEFDFILIGISSPSKDYKLGWELNNELKLKLNRIDDVLKQKAAKSVPQQSELIAPVDNGPNHAYSHYRHSDEEKGIEYDLVSNKSDSGVLIPEQKQADYFLIIRGVYSQAFGGNVLGIIRKMTNVQTAFSIDASKLKSKDFLIMND